MATLAVRLALDGPLGGQPTLVIFTVPIMLSAYAGGLGAGLLATLLSYLAASYYLLPPLHSFAVASPAERWQQFFVAAAGIVISVLNEALHRARRRADVATREYQDAQMALRESEGRYRAVVESSPEAIMVHRSGRVFFANPAAMRLFGATSAQDLVGRRVLDLMHPDSHHIVRDRLALVTAPGGERPLLEIRVVALDGTVKDVEGQGTVIIYDGEPAILGSMRDITERRRAAEALRDVSRDLQVAEASDRLKSAFLATMSHELRTPLNSMIGFTGVLLQRLPGPLNPEQAKQLGMVQGSARHLLALINDLLDLSKIEAGQLDVHAEPFDLRLSIERVVASLTPLAEQKGLTLRCVLPPNLGDMVSDPLRVEQILINLLNNGIKFTDHGSVTLTANLVEPGPSVRLRVTDTGIGIKPQDLPVLFEAFRQVDSSFTRQKDGSGLGLAISSRLAALLGGEISIASEWSKGSEFTVTLPSLPPAASPR